MSTSPTAAPPECTPDAITAEELTSETPGNDPHLPPADATADTDASSHKRVNACTSIPTKPHKTPTLNSQPSHRTHDGCEEAQK